MWAAKQTTKQPWALEYSQDDLRLRLANVAQFLRFADYLTFQQLLARMYEAWSGALLKPGRQSPFFC
jgi:hypothetical protein